MKTRAVILAGGEGSRLSILTAKRTKPAVPFAGKYRIIDFALSNCVNSNIFDVMVLAQYRPQSLIEHTGAGGPWDLDRDFTGGLRILTPYKARGASDWYLGTADAVQQNFLFIKRGSPDLVLILSGDHIYRMDYSKMIDFHMSQQADVTMAVNRVPLSEASRFGIVEVDANNKVHSFVEKPAQPTSNLVNMGVYLFNLRMLSEALLEDHKQLGSAHDFGRNILPRLVETRKRVMAYPFEGYWMDVGTTESYWQAHMDLLDEPAPIDLNDRSWIIHTRTEERAPARIQRGATVVDCMITNGCVISPQAHVERSVLSPGVIVEQGAVVRESIILNDCVIGAGAHISHTILDKNVEIGPGAQIGLRWEATQRIALIGKNGKIPPGLQIEAGALLGPDIIASDLPPDLVRGDDLLHTKRLPHEI